MRKTTILKFVFFIGSLWPFFTSPVYAQTDSSKENFKNVDKLRGALNPNRSNFHVTYYDLSLGVDIPNQSIRGFNNIYIKALVDVDSIQLDLFRNYKILAVMGDSSKLLRYRKVGDHFIVQFNKTIPKGQIAKVQVHYSGKPQAAQNAPWDGGFVWAKDSLGKPWVAVACEGLGASSWWPCKDHLSDEPDSMLLNIEAPETLLVVCNGQFRSMIPVGDGYNRSEWFISYPINTYNVTLNIGDYVRINDEYKSKAGHLNVDYFVLSYHEARAKAYFGRETKKMLDCFEKYFGPYPFTRDGYALVEDPYWGMEHQGAVAYGNHFTMNEFGFDYILVHESAHEWWGNSISCNDQSEMWLHEAFATYAEALYLEYYKNYGYAVNYLKGLKFTIANKEPIIGPRDINYYERKDNDMYMKGAWMLHTLRNYIANDTLWFKILYTFQTRYKFKIVTTQDFTKLVNEITGKNYDAFFKVYLNYAKPPYLYWKTVKKRKKTILTYKWKVEVDNFTMPVQIRIPDGKGFKDMQLDVTTKEQELNLKGIKPDDISINTDNGYFFIEKVSKN